MKYVKSFIRKLNEAGETVDTSSTIGGFNWSSGIRRERKQTKIRRATKKYQVLRFIYEAGHKGVRYSDIVKYVVQDLNGKLYDPVKHRGYWSVSLTGATGGRYSTHRPTGILNVYCKKNENGLWVLDDRKLIDHFNDNSAKGLGFDEEDIDIIKRLDLLR